MSELDDLQEAKEEAEFLRKRSWDFLARLEKLESEFQCTTDADKRQTLKIRIKNTRRLLEDYFIEYESLCKEAKLTPEVFTPKAPSRDIVSVFSRKTEKAREDLLSGEIIDLPPFFLVPSRNPKFTGRRKEVREFINRVLDGGAFTISGVKGMGGIGKSEIAKEVCHLLHLTWDKRTSVPEYVSDLLVDNDQAFFNDGMLWIQFEPESQTPKSLTEWLLPQIVGAQAKEKIKNLDDLAKVLADKDVLVVLDSVEQNLRTFDYVLERFKGKFPLIITSRVAIPGVDARNIDVLNDDEAEALFIAHLENSNVNEEQREIIRELCHLQSNYPLIIRNTASLVTADHANLPILKSQYQKNRALLLEESGQHEGGEKRHAMVKSCFGISYDSLDEPEQNAFLHSALFNNPFTIDALSNLLEVENSDEMKHMVKRLVKFSLLNALEGKDRQATTYELHPLMREFALDLLLKDVQTIAGKKEKITALVTSLQKAKEKQTLLKLLINDPSLVEQAVAAIKYCNQVFDFSTIYELMNILNGPMDAMGYWDDKVTLNRLAIRSSVALQDRYGEAHWRIQLSDTWGRKIANKREVTQVQEEISKALLIFTELKEPSNILYAKLQLAYTEQELANWDTAIKNSHQGIREASRYGDLYWLGSFVGAIGNIHSHFYSNQTDLLLCFYYKIFAKNILQDYQKDNLLLVFKNIVDAHYQRGQAQICVARYKQLAQLSQVLNNTEHLAYSVELLFQCALHMMDSQSCGHHLKIYLEISTKLGLPESQRQKLVGCYAWLSGDYQTAIQAFSSAMAENNLSPYFYNYWMGKTYLYQNNLEQAEAYLNKTLEYHRSTKNTVEVAQVSTQLALLALKCGEIHKAAEIFMVAIKTQEAYDIKISPEDCQIEQAIRSQLPRNVFETIAKNAQAIDLKPYFSLPKLPESQTGQDDKLMMLVPAGGVFIGKGEMETPDIEELLDNIEQYLFPYRQHSGQYQVPEHPDSVFDEDRFLFLLEQNKVISDKEKQKLLTQLPELSQEIINEQLETLQKEYDDGHTKAKEIYLYPYYIDRTPVSNTEYAEFCTATEHACPSHWPAGKFQMNTASLPVVNISLDDAQAYARWAGKELPTSAEWEKACRGEKGSVYPWGNAWNENQVKAGNGELRKLFEADYQKLNGTYPEEGGMVHFEKPRYDPKLFSEHPLSEFDETVFLNLLQGSVSLNLSEKQRVVDNISTLTQFQIDKLTKVFTEEREKFRELRKEHPDDVKLLRKNAYLLLMQSDLQELYMPTLLNSVSNESTYGVRDLTGTIAHWTLTERNGGKEFCLKGGSWFSENPQQACQAWEEEWLAPQNKRMDVGFRCVKPIFSREDLGEILPDADLSNK